MFKHLFLYRLNTQPLWGTEKVWEVTHFDVTPEQHPNSLGPGVSVNPLRNYESYVRESKSHPRSVGF